MSFENDEACTKHRISPTRSADDAPRRANTRFEYALVIMILSLLATLCVMQKMEEGPWRIDHSKEWSLPP